MEEKLNQQYAILKDPKITEYNHYLKDVTSLADVQLEIYKNSINSNINYENQEEFESSINEKHLNAKKKSLDGFTNSQKLTFAPRKSQIKEKLIEMIDSEYLTFIESAVNTFINKQNADIQEIFDSKLNKYNSSLNKVTDFDREDFHNYINNRHKTEKEKLIKEFTQETYHFSSIRFKSKLKSQLVIDMDNIFEAWLTLKKAKIDRFDGIRTIKNDLIMDSISSIKLRNYLNAMKEYNDYSYSKHGSIQAYYVSLMEKRPQQISIAISEFKKETSKIQNRTSVENKITQLMTQLKAFPKTEAISE